MRLIKGKQVKIISGKDAFDFETKLNASLSKLNEAGIRYDLQLSPQAGLLAYIVYDTEEVVPETMKDCFNMDGEKRFCIECPFFVRPTDGRRKWSVCNRTQRKVRADRECCEETYEELASGKIKMLEVHYGKNT